MKKISESDRWNPAHFGEMPRKLDSDGNPMIFWDANRLDISPGIPSGNRVTRDRRAALGNCLDVRLAQIVWERVFYLNSLS